VVICEQYSHPAHPLLPVSLVCFKKVVLVYRATRTRRMVDLSGRET